MVPVADEAILIATVSKAEIFLVFAFKMPQRYAS
jgi:hypothetical protein